MREEETVVELAPGVTVADSELVYRASRSGGPGGQNVNKVATRIELTFNVEESPSISEGVRRRLVLRLAHRLDQAGQVRVVSSAGRTQSENRRRALEGLRRLIREALRPKKKRIPTKPTRGSVARRLREKKARSERKDGRRTPSRDD